MRGETGKQINVPLDKIIIITVMTERARESFVQTRSERKKRDFNNKLPIP
jgi:hypothetical protein